MVNHLTTPKKKTLLVTPKKKVAPASIVAQKAWGGLSKLVKGELRKSLPDNDRDGVPNGFDCRPKNKRRQEAFLPKDAQYIESHSTIKLGKRIGSGYCGDVHNIVGNTRLVAKVPKFFADSHEQLPTVRRNYLTCELPLG